MSFLHHIAGKVFLPMQIFLSNRTIGPFQTDKETFEVSMVFQGYIVIHGARGLVVKDTNRLLA